MCTIVSPGRGADRRVHRVRLLGTLVVTAHRVRVHHQLQVRVAGQVLADQPVEALGQAVVGVRVLQQHLDRGVDVDDLRLVRRRVGDVAAVVPLVGVLRAGERTDRGQRVAEASARELRCPLPAALLLAQQPGQRPVLVERGQRGEQPARDRVTGERRTPGRRRGDRRQVQVDGVVAEPTRRVGVPVGLGELRLREARHRRVGR